MYAHVLLTYEAYEQLAGVDHVLDTLGQPAGVEDIEFDLPISRETPPAAVFD